jgi:benzoate membrane transport protein
MAEGRKRARAVKPDESMWLGVFERGVGFRSSLRDFRKHLNASTISTAIAATLIGPPVIMIFLATARQAGLNQQQSLSWIFMAMASGGIGGILLSLYYKKPLMGATSIVGAVMLASVIGNFDYPVVLGAYVASGLIVLVLGVSGIFNKVIRWLPREIIMAMIAGVFMRYGTGLITNGMKVPIVCGGAFLCYLLCETYIKKVPRIMGALIGGIIAAFLTNTFKTEALQGMTINLPSFFMPAIPTWDAMVAIAIPLAVISVASEDVQAIGVLLSEGYDNVPKGTKVPINATTAATGVFSMVVPFFGCHDWHLSGPLNAIIAGPSSGPKEGRYVAAVITGVIFVFWGLAGAAVDTFFAKAVPKPFIDFVAGLAIIGVLTRALRSTFSAKKLSLGPFMAFVVAASGVHVGGVGAPFWSLVVGVGVSLIGERHLMGRGPDLHHDSMHEGATREEKGVEAG